ncbi:MAG: hypothetical protein RMI01_06285 [Thermodesulfovibrio sp.]|nr:hypothetical protein [Thermodesulfovibrio sp.]
MISLKGNKFDLEELPELLKSSEVNVIEESGCYYLQSSEFELLSSPEEVLEKVRILIKLINDSMKLIFDNFHNIEEDGVTLIKDDGKRIHYVFVETKFELRAKVNIKVDSTDNEYLDSKLSAIEQLIFAAKKDNSIEKALQFFSKNTWIDLYKVYEIIRDDVGGEHQIVANNWATKNDLERFSRTAQSKDAIGDDARHASKKYTPPAKPMSFNEAKELKKRILIKWLNYKNINLAQYFQE